jgi:hypothetical protein
VAEVSTYSHTNVLYCIDSAHSAPLLSTVYTVFSTRALVKKWKQHQNTNKGKSEKQADQHFQGSEVSDNKEDIKIMLIPLTPQPATHSSTFR